MSGFSTDWLALREPADHAARNAGIAAQVGAHFADRDHVGVLDLGCGSGSNLRALAEILPARQSWRLVDWDDALLSAARTTLAAWGDGEASNEGGALALRRGSRHFDVRFERVDLAQNLEAALAGDLDLVTATAFFDLVSTDWIAGFCDALAARRLPLYAVLTYDGVESWTPPHRADAPVLAAFHAHQQGDKGFGPAAGPFAVANLERELEQRGYRVSCAASPWRLGPDDAALIGELAAGAAAAVAETGLVPREDLDDWLAARRSGASVCVGHKDLFAIPG